MWDEKIIIEANEILKNSYTENSLPKRSEVLRFLEIPPQNIKIIILGQDPYPTKGVANGRAFAVNLGMPIPQSLKNIFKEIQMAQGYVKTNSTLDLWAKQGVLLLNTSLTVHVGKPNSDKKVWENFMQKLVVWLDKNYKFTWVLWGKEAQKFTHLLKNKKIEDAHPSPLSFHRRNGNTFKILNFIEW